jgi:hypothetical protein
MFTCTTYQTEGPEVGVDVAAVVAGAAPDVVANHFGEQHGLWLVTMRIVSKGGLPSS